MLTVVGVSTTDGVSSAIRHSYTGVGVGGQVLAASTLLTGGESHQTSSPTLVPGQDVALLVEEDLIFLVVGNLK